MDSFLNRLSNGNICQRKSCKHHTLQGIDQIKISNSPFSGSSVRSTPVFLKI